MSALLNKILLLCCLTSASLIGAVETASAQQPQEDKKDPVTTPPDYQYGRYSIEGVGELPGKTPAPAPVDRRDAIDPFAGQGAFFPTAHVPKERTISYKNHLFLGNQLAFTPNERVTLNASFVFAPPGLGFATAYEYDQFSNLSARVNLFRSRDLAVSVQPGVLWRRGRLADDTRSFGGQLNLLVDYFIGDAVVIGAGLLGHLPFSFTYNEQDTSNCQRRDDFFEVPSCATLEPVTQTLPDGGRFLLGWVGFTIYAPKNINFKGEIFTGARRGTYLDLEGALFEDDAVVTQRERYSADTMSFGFIDDAPLSATLGVGWSQKAFGAQLALIMIPTAFNDGSPMILPMSTIGFTY